MEIVSNKTFCFFSSFKRFVPGNLVYERQGPFLVEHGYVVKYFVSDNLPAQTINGIQIISTGYKPSGYLKRIFIAPFYMFKKLRKENAAIYQTNSIDFLFIGLLLKLSGRKVVFNLTESHPYTIKNNRKIPVVLKKTLIFLLAQYMKFSLRKFDAVFTVSENIVDYLKKWKVKKVYLLANFPVLNPHYKLNYNDYKNREDTVIYFGSIYEISKQEHFIRALEKLNGSVKYLLAGRFGDKNYERSIQSMSFWKNIEFINGFAKEELPSLLARATISNVLRDFSLTGSPKGSLGVIKIFESMEAALPIICSDVPVYRKIIEKYNCGILIDPNDTDQIFKAIQFLIENKEKAYEMGQNGRRAVIEEFNWAKQAEMYGNIINEILK